MMFLRRYLALLALTFMVSCLDLRGAVVQALHLESCSAMPGSAELLTTLLANLVPDSSCARLLRARLSCLPNPCMTIGLPISCIHLPHCTVASIKSLQAIFQICRFAKFSKLSSPAGWLENGLRLLMQMAKANN
jgi:hypothetical protein